MVPPASNGKNGNPRALDPDMERVIVRAVTVARIDLELLPSRHPEAGELRASADQHHALNRAGNDLEIAAAAELDGIEVRHRNGLGSRKSGRRGRERKGEHGQDGAHGEFLSDNDATL